MRAYYTLFKMRLLKGLQYRMAALAGVLTQFFWAFMYIMIYQAFYQSSNTPQPLTFHELVQMIWLQQSFLLLMNMWLRDTELFHLVTSGNIAYELCRPASLYGLWYARLVAQRLSGTLLRCFPILIVASLLPKPYGFSLPASPWAFVLFLITLVLALILVVAISMILYISVFYTMSATGSSLIFTIIGDFFSGLIIPIPLMPKLFQKIAYSLPFRYTADLPFRIYNGNIGTRGALIGIVIQAIWIITLIGLGRLWMKQTMKKVVIQGG